MPINPAIALGVEPTKPIDFLGAYGNALSLKNLVNQGRAQDLQIQQAERENQKQMRLSDLARAAGGDMDKFAAGYGEIDPLGAMDFGIKTKKLDMERRKAALDQAEGFNKLFLGSAQAVKDSGYSQEVYNAELQRLRMLGVPADMLANVPAQVSPQYIDANIAASMSNADRIARERLTYEQSLPVSEIGRLTRDQDMLTKMGGSFVPGMGEPPGTAAQGIESAPDGAMRPDGVVQATGTNPFDAAIAKAAFGQAPDGWRYVGQSGKLAPMPEVQAQQERLRRAGATNVNVNSKEQDESAKVIGKGYGEQYTNIQQSEFASRKRLGRAQRLEQLLDGVQTGKLTPMGTQLAGYAHALGFEIDPKLGNKEAAIALENEMALELRNPAGGAGMPGAMSDADRNFLQNMSSFTNKTTQGRQLMMETYKAIAKRDAEIAKLAREYKKRNGGRFDEGFYDEIAIWSEQNPLFPDAAAIEAEKKRRGLR